MSAMMCARSRAANDGLRVIDDVLDRYRRRLVEAEDDVADAIADEDDVDAGGFDELTKRRIVGRCNRKERLPLRRLIAPAVTRRIAGSFRVRTAERSRSPLRDFTP